MRFNPGFSPTFLIVVLIFVVLIPSAKAQLVESDIGFNARPNPANGAATVDLIAPVDGNYLLQLSDPMGRSVSILNGSLLSGIHQFEANMHSKGLYILVVTNGATVKSIKLMNVGTAHAGQAGLTHKGSQAYTPPEEALDGNPNMDVPDGAACPELPSFEWMGKTYTTVRIGTQCWMAQNLDAGEMISGEFEQEDNELIEKYCYNNDSLYCEKYGGLYQWDEIMIYDLEAVGCQGICPEGFHIPADAEWKELEGVVDSQYGKDDPEWDFTGQRGFDAAKNLKTTGWLAPDNGNDSLNFSVLPSGIFHYAGYFTNYRTNGRFWTSNKGPAHGAWYRSFNSGYNTIYRNNHGDRDSGFSLRCIKDQ